MLVYVIVMILTGILLFPAQWFYKKHFNNFNKRTISLDLIISFSFFILAFMPYFLLSALRYGTGTDFFSYSTGFYRAIKGQGFYGELLYSILMKGLSYITYNPQWLFVVTSFIFCFLIFLSIKRMSRNWCITGMYVMLSCMLFDSFNNIRQSIAIASCICALSYASERKYIRCTLLVLFAYGFHRSSVVMIPLYIIAGIKPIRKYYPFIAIALLVLTPVYLPLTRMILQNTSYYEYLNMEQYQYTLWYFLVPQIPILLFCLFNYKEIMDKHESVFVLMIANVIATIIGIVTFQLPIVETMYRAYRWFSWSSIFLVASMFDIKAKTSVKLCYFTITASLMTITMYYMIVLRGFHDVLPYIIYH